jgi:hypothetical protein
MSVNYAVREAKSAPLASDFARQFVVRHFGQQVADIIYANLPTYKRGPNKGQPKGWVIWTKCVKGGWVRSGAYDHDAQRGNGYVMAPGTHDVRIVLVNPGYLPDKYPSLAAGDRRGLPTDPNRETDEQWTKRCGRAILQLQGKPVPAELEEPPYVPPFNPYEFVKHVLTHFVLSTQQAGYANFANTDSPEAQAMQAIAKIIMGEL